VSGPRRSKPSAGSSHGETSSSVARSSRRAAPRIWRSSLNWAGWWRLLNRIFWCQGFPGQADRFGIHGQRKNNEIPGRAVIAATPVTDEDGNPPAAFRHVPYTRRGEQAIAAFQEADHLDAIPRISFGDDVVYGLDAKKQRARGEVLLQPATSDPPIEVSSGEAVYWDNKNGEPFLGATARIIDTLEHPNSVSAGASGDRMSAAVSAGVLEPAIDTAQSAQASNSIEKMLCHQMAGAHFTAMRLLEQSRTPHLPPGEAVRSTNAAARMMDVYQNACLTLQKMKTKGTQRVIVQYQQVKVADGGQAVVAGRVGRGSRGRRGGRKNAQ